MSTRRSEIPFFQAPAHCKIENRKATKISVLSSGKIDKYNYLTDEKILSNAQSRMTEQAKFTYFPSGKAFGKQTKTIENQGKNRIDVIMNQKER